MCKYHENIELLLNGLRNVLPGIPKSADDLSNATVRNFQDLKCMARECSEYKIERPVEKLFTNEGRVRKQRVDSTAADAKGDLIAQLRPFGRHIYNIKRQYEELKYLKENLC